MKYLIVQDWQNTRGNHAGMEHMCDMLVERYPGKYVKYVSPEEYHTPVYHNRIQRKLHEIYDKYFYHRKNLNRYKRICRPMLAMLKPGDEVFLLEYLFPAVSQFEFAQFLRKKYPWLKIYALSHLSPSMYSYIGLGRSDIQEWSHSIDKMLTLGSSLSSFLYECGIPKDKISTGFHYVDDEYYTPLSIRKDKKTLSIICIGAVQRNRTLMAGIIECFPQVEWFICRGNDTSADYLYKDLKNVHLKGFMSEQELRKTMEFCDISMNVMEDTIGSNVITTSMAMGMALIVSDVGSIRDYCDTQNAIFCENTIESFKEALLSLINDEKKVLEMKKHSKEISKRLNIRNVDKWFSNLA